MLLTSGLALLGTGCSTTPYLRHDRPVRLIIPRPDLKKLADETITLRITAGTITKGDGTEPIFNSTKLSKLKFTGDEISEGPTGPILTLKPGEKQGWLGVQLKPDQEYWGQTFLFVIQRQPLLKGQEEPDPYFGVGSIVVEPYKGQKLPVFTEGAKGTPRKGTPIGPHHLQPTFQ